MKKTLFLLAIMLSTLTFASTIPAKIGEYTWIGDSYFNPDGTPVLAANCTMNIYFSNNSAYNATNYNMSVPNSAGLFAKPFNFTTNDTYNAQLNCTDSAGTMATETIYIDAKTSNTIVTSTDSTPLTVTLTFIGIIILLFIAASRASYPFNTLFASFACMTILAFLMVFYSLIDSNSLPAQLLQPAILFLIQIAPFVAGGLILMLFWNEAKKTPFFRGH